MRVQQQKDLPNGKKAPFQAAVAIYPLCFEKIKDLETPFLIFIGEKDTRASATACRGMKVIKKDNVEYQLIVYPNAGHLYDFPCFQFLMTKHRLRIHMTE